MVGYLRSLRIDPAASRVFVLRLSFGTGLANSSYSKTLDVSAVDVSRRSSSVRQAQTAVMSVETGDERCLFYTSPVSLLPFITPVAGIKV